MTFLKMGFFMKRCTLLLVWGLSGLGLLWAQNAGLSGQVLDGDTDEPLGFTSLSLFAVEDSSPVAGVLADSSGSFFFSALPSGVYYLEARFLGYEVRRVAGLRLAQDEQRSLDTIRLKATQRLLEEIEITGRQSQSFHRIDRQVYDATQFQQAQGGSATDALRNLPSVSLDAQGGISVRGSDDFMVMIDGKQMQGDPRALLSQLPANAIASIEILTTPSAKYDPDGKGGIINIRTKKGATDGFYLRANGLLGLPSIEPYGNAEPARRFGGDLTVNYKKGPWDLSGGLDYRRSDLSGRRVGYVNTYLDEVLTEYPSVGERSFDESQYSGRLSVSYTPSPSHQLRANLLVGDRTKLRTANILYQPQQRRAIPEGEFLGAEVYWELYQQSGAVTREGEAIDSLTYYNENLRVRQGDFFIAGLDYQWQLPDSSTLSFSGLYEYTLLGGPTDNTVLAWPNVADTLQYQFNTNDNPLDGVRLKIDYSRQLGALQWESGYQFRYLYHPGDFLYLDRNLETDRWVENPEFTNRIELERMIHAAYTQVSGQWNRLTYSLGLRLEYMDRRVGLASPDTTYAYKLWQPFPTLNLLYDLGSAWVLKGGYSRRIARTTTFKMTPFPEREHNETLEQGDAELLPEFIDLAELGLVKTWGDHSVFLTGYYRQVANVINRVNTIYNDSILNRIYTNAGDARALGLEVGLTLYPTAWWKIYAGGNVYDYRIQGDLFGDPINTSSLIYSLNATSDFTLGKTLTLQAALNYLSQRVTAQGVDSRFYNPSLSLRKTFLDERIALSVQWLSLDLGLLESNEQRITTSRQNFFTTTNYIYEVDRVMISLSYQFNQPSNNMKFIKSEFGEKEF